MRVLLAGALLLLGQAPVAAQRTVNIPRGYDCATCRISMSRVAVLHTTATHGQPMTFARVERDSRGRYFVAPTITPGQISVFAADGRLLRTIGRQGDGPGEFREINFLKVGPGDSLHVVHDLRYITTVTPELEFVRRVSVQPRSFLAGPLLFWDDGRMLSLRYGTGGGADYPLRFLDADGRTGPGFGTSVEWGYGDDMYSGFVALEGRIWAAKRQKYELDVFEPSTALLTRYRRVTPWFPRLSDKKRRNAGYYKATVQSISASESLLWILSMRPTESPPKEMPVAVQAAANQGPPSIDELAETQDHFLEVFDSKSGRMLARAQLKNHIPGGFLGGDQLYTYSEDEQGIVSVVVWRLQLSR